VQEAASLQSLLLPRTYPTMQVTQSVLEVAQVKQGDVQEAATLQSLLPPRIFPTMQVIQLVL